MSLFKVDSCNMKSSIKAYQLLFYKQKVDSSCNKCLRFHITFELKATQGRTQGHKMKCYLFQSTGDNYLSQ